MSVCQQRIREDLARLGLVGRHDPAIIEAWMRLEHGTLDRLTAADFQAEVKIASDCADYSTTEENRALAESYGLSLSPPEADRGWRCLFCHAPLSDPDRSCEKPECIEAFSRSMLRMLGEDASPSQKGITMSSLRSLIAAEGVKFFRWASGEIDDTVAYGWWLLRGEHDPEYALHYLAAHSAAPPLPEEHHAYEGQHFAQRPWVRSTRTRTLVVQRAGLDV